MPDGSPTKRRRKSLAGLFSLIIPGLGQLYNTQPRKALLLFAISVIWPFALFCSSLALSFEGLLLVMALILVYRIGIVADAIFVARRFGTVSLMWFNRWYVYLGFWGLAALSSIAIEPALRSINRVELFRIPTPAMAPTLLVGDYFAVDEWAYMDSAVTPGDIILFRHPESQRIYVMRCVAIAGDAVEIEAGTLYVNDERAADELQGWRSREKVWPADMNDPDMYTESGNPDYFGPLAVPPESYFVLGDTRDNTEDGRFFGPIAESEILGKVRYLYFSWDSDSKMIRFGRIGKRVG